MGQKSTNPEVAVLQTQYESITDSLDEIKVMIGEKLLTRIEEAERQVDRLRWWRNAVISVSAFLWSGTLLLTPFISRLVADKVSSEIDASIDTKIHVAIDDALESYVFDVLE